VLRLRKQCVGPFVAQHGEGRKYGFGCTASLAGPLPGRRGVGLLR